MRIAIDLPTKRGDGKMTYVYRCLLLLMMTVSPFLRANGQETYEEWVARGLQAAEHDSLLEAEGAFKQALKVSPADYRNVLLFSNLGRVQETIYWQRLEAAKGEGVERVTDSLLAQVSEDKRKPSQLAEQAIESYTMALNFAPNSVPVLAARAQMYLRMHLWEKAIHDFTSLVDLRPDNTVARNYRAYAYVQLRRFDEAHVDYERILSKDPTSYEARLGLAILEQKMGHLDRAVEQMDLLVTANPDSVELYSVRASIYAENHQPELALMDLDHAVEAAPQNTDYLLARGYLHLECGNKRLARHDFEQALRLGVPISTVQKALKECQ